MEKTHTIAIGSALTILGAIAAYKLIQGSKHQVEDIPLQKKTITEILTSYSKEFNESGAIQNIIPRKFETEANLESLTSNLFYRRTTSHLNSLSKSLSEPIYDLLDRGGKKWRPILCMLIAQLYGHKKEEVFDIAALCEIIHNGTLIVDDIEDSSTIRRDKECVHLLYGVDISVNAGNFMYFAPLNYLLRSKRFTDKQKIRFGQIYAEEMTSLHVGQGWDILWHNTEKLEGNYPSEQHYLQMTAHKTGVLARLSARLVCVYLGLSEKESEVLSRFAQTMGVAFQIQDDLLNLEGEDYAATKGYNGEDIHEGKITLMVLYFLNSQAPQEDKDKLLTILRKKTEDREQIKQAIGLLRNSGTFERAKDKMHQLVDRSWNEVRQNLPHNVYREYLKQLSEFGIKRTK